MTKAKSSGVTAVGLGTKTSQRLKKHAEPWPLLDVGAGNNPRQGSFAVDIERRPAINLVCDVAHLPFRDNSFNEVGAFDIIEHFPTWQVPEVLAEWIRVTADKITIKTPNVKIIAQAYLEGYIPLEEFSRKMFGGGSLDRNHYNMHKTGNDPNSLRKLLESLNLDVMDVAESGVGGDWSNAIISAKKR